MSTGDGQVSTGDGQVSEGKGQSAKVGGTFVAFRFRNFRLMWSASLLSSSGTWQTTARNRSGR